jgi:hypothetical protein
MVRMFFLGLTFVEEITVGTLLGSFVSIHSPIKVEGQELLRLAQTALYGEINQVVDIESPFVTGQTVGSFVVP